MPKYILSVLALLLCTPADAARIATETTENDVKVRWSVTNVSEQGVMRIDEGSWQTAATASSTASSGSASLSYDRSAESSTMIYDPTAGEIISVEGSVCRVFAADSAPPPGMDFMGGAEMQAHQQQMAAALARAKQEMKNSGMSQADMEAMSRMLDGLGNRGMAQPKAKPELSLLDDDVTVGDFDGSLYRVDNSAGVEQYRVVLVDVDDVPGGRAVRAGMDGMFAIFSDYMQGMGMSGMPGQELLRVLQDPEFAGLYPVLIEDHGRGWRTEIVAADDDAEVVEFTPDCERRGMFE